MRFHITLTTVFVALVLLAPAPAQPRRATFPRERSR